MASITPLPPSSSISLTNLAPDVLTHVALCLATSSDPNPLGPPRHLLSLLLTNKRLYTLLNYRDNACLYAEIFRYQFDVRSLHRRLPSSRLTAQNLAAELIRRWTSLKRISRQGSSGDWRPRTYPDHQIKEDLMTTFLMFLESDGRNAIQLIQYAQVHNWINQYYEFRLTTIHREPTMPAETDEASLAMWIAWLLTDYRGLLMEGDSRSLNWICTPYMLGTFFYKNSFAPWTTLSLPVPGANSIRPLSPTPNDAAPLTHNTSPFFIYDTTPAALPLVHTNAPAGPPPRTRGRPTSSQHRQVAADAERFTYFGSPLSITAPLISHAATLLYFSRMQRLPFNAPNEPAQSPQEHLGFLNYQEQNKGLVYSGSTFIAGLDVVSNNMGLEGVESLLRGKRNFAPDYVHVKLPSLARSESWDDQFARLTGCWNPFEMTKELGMPKFAWTKGSLSGEWDGRFVLPDMDTYRNVMTGSNPLNTLEESFVLQDPQSWTIEEHYHVKPSASRMPTSAFVRPLGSAVRAGHPINAFIRPQTRLERVRGAYGEGLEVWEGRYDPAHGGVAFYETWRGGMQGSDVGLTQTTVEAMDNDVDMDMDDSDDDNDDENDCISIIITGTAIQRPYYIPETLPTMMGPGSTIRGTVRKWDGLITLVASPPATQTWIWRGYLVGDGNFVGRWREGSMDVRRNAYEGVFAMRRRGTGTSHTTFGRQ
ncbi:hypothetical protein FRC04_000084 [Tulasnella sp. 424]|nr:hypothetical protein FRC04_000084 [Tulasnella sp. 424]KAG8981946.1 hypothetical protein FRC05_000088 [Tulasnella sp. 425]